MSIKLRNIKQTSGVRDRFKTAFYEFFDEVVRSEDLTSSFLHGLIGDEKRMVRFDKKGRDDFELFIYEDQSVGEGGVGCDLYCMPRVKDRDLGCSDLMHKIVHVLDNYVASAFTKRVYVLVPNFGNLLPNRLVESRLIPSFANFDMYQVSFFPWYAILNGLWKSETGMGKTLNFLKWASDLLGDYGEDISEITLALAKVCKVLVEDTHFDREQIIGPEDRALTIWELYKVAYRNSDL